MRKTVYTLDIDNYAPSITELTRPLLEFWTRRIGAELFVIRDRQWPWHPPVYEKLQIYGLNETRSDDWSLYVDADALVHPETIDFTQFVKKDTVIHNGIDQAPVRWRLDRYFLRDGRLVGSCNWFTIASDWCRDLWKPLDDISYEEALDNIYPTVGELASGVITPNHLIDDYVLSRNIARYGLKIKLVPDICKDIGLEGAVFFHHVYDVGLDRKLELMKEVLDNWKVDPKKLEHRKPPPCWNRHPEDAAILSVEDNPLL